MRAVRFLPRPTTCSVFTVLASSRAHRHPAIASTSRAEFCVVPDRGDAVSSVPRYVCGCSTSPRVCQRTLPCVHGCSRHGPCIDRLPQSSPSRAPIINGMAYRVPLVHSKADPARSTIRNGLRLRIPTMSFDINNARYFSHYTTSSRMAYVFIHRQVDAPEWFQERPWVADATRQESDLAAQRPGHCISANVPWPRHRPARVSPSHHQEFDGQAEKSGGRDVYEHATALLHFAGVSKVFWPFALAHYVGVFNCVCRPSAQGRSSFFNRASIRARLLRAGDGLLLVTSLVDSLQTDSPMEREI